MRYMLFLAFCTVFGTSTQFTLAGADDITRECVSARIRHHPKILVTITENTRTNFCSFGANLPPKMASSGEASSRAAKAFYAAMASPSEEAAISMLRADFAPALVDVIGEAVLTTEFEKEGGAAIFDLVKSRPQEVASCAHQARIGKEYTVGGDGTQLVCSARDDQTNYLFDAESQNVRVSLLIPRELN